MAWCQISFHRYRVLSRIDQLRQEPRVSGNTGHVKNHDDFPFGARLCFTGIRHRDKNHVCQTHAVGTTNNEKNHDDLVPDVVPRVSDKLWPCQSVRGATDDDLVPDLAPLCIDRSVCLAAVIDGAIIGSLLSPSGNKELDMNTTPRAHVPLSPTPSCHVTLSLSL